MAAITNEHLPIEKIKEEVFSGVLFFLYFLHLRVMGEDRKKNYSKKKKKKNNGASTTN